MEISFIGAGNVAWHLSRALENAGNSVNEIFSRNPENAQELEEIAIVTKYRFSQIATETVTPA